VATTLGTAVTTVLLRHYDRLAWQEERSTMAQIHRAVREHVMDSTSIPGPGDLLTSAASRAGRSPTQVAVNARGNPRVVLVEPGLGLGPTGSQGLPFSQGMIGSRQPQNSRLVLLSSAGEALPTNLVSGATLTASQFSNLWVTAQGQVPAGWNWAGRAEDLCIERVQLADLFVRVTLRYHTPAPEHQGRYTLASQGFTTNAPALLPGLTNFSPYVVRGTFLSLFGTNNVLQFRDVVQEEDVVYTCRNGVWHRGLGTYGSRVGPVIRHPTPQEFADGLMSFMSPEVPLWAQNTTATKAQLQSAITNFLSVGAYNNQSAAMGNAQKALIDAWVAFTGANPNKP
jgi:hypothetical protein